MPRSVLAALAVAVAALGVGLGFAAPPLARWLQDLLEQTPLPVHGVVGVLADLTWAWSVPILAGLGVVGGILLAMIAAHESLHLEVHDDHLEHRREKLEGWVERRDVATVHRDAKDLVLLGPGGAPRLRLDVDDLSPAAVREAFVGHGWPWHDDVPHDDEFVVWVDGRPGLTEDEHALLRRRRRERKDHDALAEIDRGLAAHGLAVRRRGDRLQVRHAGSGAPGATEGVPPSGDPDGVH
jgi:hypothetical protein